MPLPKKKKKKNLHQDNSFRAVKCTKLEGIIWCVLKNTYINVSNEDGIFALPENLSYISLLQNLHSSPGKNFYLLSVVIDHMELCRMHVLCLASDFWDSSMLVLSSITCKYVKMHPFDHIGVVLVWGYYERSCQGSMCTSLSVNICFYFYWINAWNGNDESFDKHTVNFVRNCQTVFQAGCNF